MMLEHRSTRDRVPRSAPRLCTEGRPAAALAFPAAALAFPAAALAFPAAALALLTLVGCQSREAQLCAAQLQEAQTVVAAVEAKELTSVSKALSVVEGARAVCDRAERQAEVHELTKARNQLQGQVDYLRKRASDPAQRKLTPAEVEERVLHGDPSCPKGQAYKHRDSGKEIRCTGAQPADMAWKEAREYLSRRGMTVRTGAEPGVLEAEYGAERFIYRFARVDDPGPARCLTITPPPGMSWQEAVSRATGVHPQRLTREGPVRTARGPTPLRIDGDDESPVVQIGDCGK